MDRSGWQGVRDEAELRAVVGEPVPRVAEKVRRSLHPIDRAWLAASPLCLLATTAADGSVDVSPKGDPPGVAHVLDERTLVLPDRPGNKRVDGFRNVLQDPNVGMIFVIPGRGDSLRVNGRAELLRDAPFFDDLVVRGNRPALALVVHVDEVFYHCSKAFLRSRTWEPGSWQPGAAPSRPVIAKALERPDTPLAELEAYYGPTYADRLYG
ncbi:hypothetical protein EV189_0262 [Motilibacter rhizosphaerae]|uniref:Pyridoxamine 5'-phosphate oxidase N-terminal domain-containing protein n=1 Tax=Motilibacter rhizosphaerae TaxID=598652 RepID=A0A4Q7NVM7_9ACTN|nr:MSMEG_1061 family FMN-dependent PPOX-type flavoprotein [Motilibacter rhizosphaerae]RZS91030.1 hypothetical protein EV189_0262 [Motilibacter rhizosphaerae]